MHGFPILVLIILTLFSKILFKTWLTPAVFFGLCWSFFLLMPSLFSPNYKVDQLGVWFILIFSMSCTAGSILAYRPRTVHKKIPFVQNPNRFIIILGGLNIISFIGLVMLFQFATTTYNTLGEANGWLSIPNLISIDRYGGYLDYPWLTKYSLYAIYPANLLGGTILAINQSKKWINLFSFTPLIIAIMLGILEGARTSILLGMVLFFSSWMSIRAIYGDQNESQNSWLKIIFLGGFILITFTGFFILIQWVRQGMDTIIVDLLFDRIQAYFFGYLAAFTQWIGQVEQVQFSGGLTSFAGPFNLLGIMERPLGFYDPMMISNGISTNIFTAFRGLVNDFSIPGAICIAFGIGFLIQTIFQEKEKDPLKYSIPISIFYAFTLYSPLISIFHYNSIIFSWVVFASIIKFNKNGFLASYR